MHPAAIVSFVVGVVQTLVWAAIAALALQVFILPMFRKEVVTHEPDRHADAHPDAD